MLDEIPAQAEYVTVAQAAALLQYSTATIRRLIRDGLLISAGRGQLRRIRRAAIEELMSGDQAWQANAGKTKAASTKTGTGNGGRRSAYQTANGKPLAVLTGKPRKPS